MAAKGAEGQTSIYSLYFHIIFKKDGSAREKNLVLHQNGTMEYSFHQLIGNLSQFFSGFLIHPRWDR